MYIKKIRTTSGDKQIDYKALANLPIRNATIDLSAADWEGNASPYSQVVTIEGITKKTQVDLTPSVEQLVIFHEKDLALVAVNDNKIVTVYAIGDKPKNDYTMQVTLTEADADGDKYTGEIIGITVGTTMKRPVPTPTEEDEGKALVVKDGELSYQPIEAGGGDTPSGDCDLPPCDSTNEGQFLRVVDGAAAWSIVPRAEDAKF